MSVVPQQVEPDSLRAALQAVFRARDYRWSEPSSTWLWLTEQWHGLLDWLELLRVASPARYYLLLAALTLVLLAMLTHVTWVVWRSLRPREATDAPTAVAAPPRGAAWHLAEAQRLIPLNQRADKLTDQITAHPKDATKLFELAQTYKQLGDYGEARKLLEEATDVPEAHRARMWQRATGAAARAQRSSTPA